MTERLEQQQRDVTVPSEDEFVAKVKGVEQARARATSNIQEQREAAAAREKEIESMQVIARAKFALISPCSAVFFASEVLKSNFNRELSIAAGQPRAKVHPERCLPPLSLTHTMHSRFCNVGR